MNTDVSWDSGKNPVATEVGACASPVTKLALTVCESLTHSEHQWPCLQMKKRDGKTGEHPVREPTAPGRQATVWLLLTSEEAGSQGHSPTVTPTERAAEPSCVSSSVWL